MYTSPSPLLQYINVIIAKHHLSQYLSVQSPHTIAAIFMLWHHYGRMKLISRAKTNIQNVNKSKNFLTNNILLLFELLI